MRVAVTGSAGRLGRAVVADLAAHGHDVTGVDRVDDGRPGTRVLRLERTLPPGTFAGQDVVVHLAALPSPGSAPDEDLYAANTAATYRTLAGAAAAGAGVVLAGSVSAYGFPWAIMPFSPDVVPVPEEHPLLPQDPYGLGKAADEAAAASFVRSGRLGSVTVLRLHHIVADEQQALRDRYGADPASGARELWGYVHLSDAARAVRLAAERSRASGGGLLPLNIAAPWSLAPDPVRVLLARHHPASALGWLPEPHSSCWAVDRAREHLGFTARVRPDGSLAPDTASEVAGAPT